MVNKIKSNYKFTRIARMPLYVVFIVSLLFLNWEAHFFYPNYAGASVLSMSAMVGAEEEAIPEESIRLRIKSNSNSPVDQQVKINIRNEVNKEISMWTGNMGDVQDARREIQARIPELETIVSDELEKLGVQTSSRVSLDYTDFPTKQYGSRVYPEGEYEAVFIELGDGLGDNWWCVLFPPLCFVDVAEKDEEKTIYSTNNQQQEQEHIEQDSEQVNEKDREKSGRDREEVQEDEEEIEVSFFVVDVVKSLWSKLPW
ncbi:stage II sporulation protein R [Salipaludibacillus sp. HK11]|uniref:stage II sporulation protein R n=1 Tax=Salipaludibacillus sp. HK11 TaxID=3394320 RepID=UPI0039FCD577